MEKENKQAAIILAGGSGVRLEPLTNINNPKFFLKNKSDLTLLELTINRAKKLTDLIYISTNAMYLDDIKRIIKKNYSGIKYLVEYESKNTGPAICAATYVLRRFNKVVVMQSDHLFLNEDEYVSRINDAFSEPSDNFVLLGQNAKTFDSELGYIKLIKDSNEVSSFSEKPKNADNLHESFINLGNFVYSPEKLISSIKPLIRAELYESLIPNFDDAEYHYSNNLFKSQGKISFDELIIQPMVDSKLMRVLMLSIKNPWLDVGSHRNIHYWLNSL